MPAPDASTRGASCSAAVADAQRKSLIGNPSFEELRLHRLGEFCAGLPGCCDPEFKIPVIADVIRSHVLSCAGDRDNELDDALIAVATNRSVGQAVAAIVDRLLLNHRDEQFGELTNQDMGGVLQGEEGRWLAANGVSPGCQLVLFDALRAVKTLDETAVSQSSAEKPAI